MPLYPILVIDSPVAQRQSGSLWPVGFKSMSKVEKRTYRDRAQYLIQAVAKRRRKVKEMATAYKGGKCIICGYRKYIGALDLHHINPETKKFGIGDKGYTRSWETIRQEIDKCVLVCANCHREVEAGITQLPAEMLVEKRGEFGEVPR